jgi:hypothetical protein
LIQKENHQRAVRSMKTRHENARMANLLASFANRAPKKLPVAIIREFQAAAKRASKTAPRKTKRVTR